MNRLVGLAAPPKAGGFPNGAIPENPENSAGDRMKAGVMRRPRRRIFRTFRIFRKFRDPRSTSGRCAGDAGGAR